MQHSCFAFLQPFATKLGLPNLTFNAVGYAHILGFSFYKKHVH